MHTYQYSLSVEVFCSYAPGDERYLGELEKHLSILQRQRLISLWHNRQIPPGADWTQAIDKHLGTASIILLLISANFMASDYCYGVEMKRALERHQKGEAWVIPILVSPVDYQRAPFARLRALPTNAIPLSLWSDKDAALANISENLRRLLEGKPLPEPIPPPTSVPQPKKSKAIRNLFLIGGTSLAIGGILVLLAIATSDPISNPNLILLIPGIVLAGVAVYPLGAGIMLAIVKYIIRMWKGT